MVFLFKDILDLGNTSATDVFNAGTLHFRKGKNKCNYMISFFNCMLYLRIKWNLMKAFACKCYFYLCFYVPESQL